MSVFKTLPKSMIFQNLAKILKNHQFWLKFEKSRFAKNWEIISFGSNLKNHHIMPKFEVVNIVVKKVQKVKKNSPH